MPSQKIIIQFELFRWLNMLWWFGKSSAERLWVLSSMWMLLLHMLKDYCRSAFRERKFFPDFCCEAKLVQEFIAENEFEVLTSNLDLNQMKTLLGVIDKHVQLTEASLPSLEDLKWPVSLGSIPQHRFRLFFWLNTWDRWSWFFIWSLCISLYKLFWMLFQTFWLFCFFV